MRFQVFFRIQIQQLMLRWRWLLPLPVFGFLGYLLGNAIIVRNPPAFLQQSGADNMVNAWDALFTGFGNAYYMAFVIANLFLLLVCDSLPESPIGQLAVFRLGSRKSWWAGKSLSVLVAALMYTLSGMLILFTLTSLRLGFSWEWSKFGWSGDTILVPTLLLRQVKPFMAALILFGMDVLGFWALGMLMQVVTLLTRRFLFGYLAALLLLIGSLGVSGSLVNVPDVLKLLPPIRNLIMTFYPYPFREVAMGWSYLYWGIALAVLFSFGLILSRQQNYYSKE